MFCAASENIPLTGLAIYSLIIGNPEHKNIYMTDYPMVHRSAIVVVPMKPLLDWINRVEPFKTMTLEEVQKDNNIYLIPDFDEPISTEDLEKEIENYITKNYKEIFYHLLSEWYLGESVYPKMNYKIFREWFKISIHTVIFDMVNKPINKEGW